MSNPVSKAIRDTRPVDDKDIVTAINREVIPVLKQCRSAINRHLGRTVIVTEDYTMDGTEGVIFADGEGSTLTVTAPTPPCKPFIVVRTGAVGTVFVAAPTGVSINQSASQALVTQFHAYHVLNDGTDFWAPTFP
jgi:hypothetical protein